MNNFSQEKLNLEVSSTDLMTLEDETSDKLGQSSSEENCISLIATLSCQK